MRRIAVLASVGVLFAAACGSSSNTGATGTGGGGPSGSESSTTSSASMMTSSGTMSSSTTASGSGGMTSSSGAMSGGGGAGGANCMFGDILCNGDTAETCDGNGGFTMTQDCTLTGQTCAPGLGCVSCLPGTGSCNGNVGTYCQPDGQGTLQEVCDALEGSTCDAATGRCTGPCGPLQLGKSYIGCDYYPTVTANIVDANTFHFAVVASNTTMNDATVTVTQGAAQITQVVVPAQSVQAITLPWVPSLEGPNSPFALVAIPNSVFAVQGAYRLRSTQPITLYQFNPLEYTLNGEFSYTNDASLLLPVNAWTGNYIVGTWHHFYSGSGFYAITASEDNTNVVITAPPGICGVRAGIPGMNADCTGNLVLNQGDVAEVVTAPKSMVSPDSDFSDPSDLTGSFIAADKPVQVIGGHQCTYIPDFSAACDHLEESLFPYETLLTDYFVAAPLVPNGGMQPNIEMVKIIATKDNTNLTYDPPQAGAPPNIALAGQYVLLDQTSADFLVTGDNPIMVEQFMVGQEDTFTLSGDPAMALAVNKAQYRKDYLFHAPTNYDYSYVNIIAPTGTAVMLDGAAVPAGDFVVIGGSGYSLARETISNAGNGTHSASAAAAFGVSVYGYGQYTSYWYPGGSDFAILHK